MKFETVRIYFFGEFSVCWNPKILLPWQRDVTTSPLHFKLANRKEAKTVRNVNVDRTLSRLKETRKETQNEF